MTAEISKRALPVALGFGAAALLAQRASADTPFSAFAFTANGTMTNRTMPARLADQFNVKDFVAVGNGSNNDTTAIQSAINAALVKGGTVFFPPGNYLITSKLRCIALGGGVGGGIHLSG